jgi:hypothetical protein
MPHGPSPLVRKHALRPERSPRLPCSFGDTQRRPSKRTERRTGCSESFAKRIKCNITITGQKNSMEQWSHIKRRPESPSENRIIVCGPSRYKNWEVVKAVLDHYRPTAIIHGHGRGVDFLCSLYAQIFAVDELRFPAWWFVHGAQAPVVRNATMFSIGRPDLLIDFNSRDNDHDLRYRAIAARTPLVFVDERDWITGVEPARSNL